MGMLQPISDYSLKKYNSFGLDIVCKQYISLERVDILPELEAFLSDSHPYFILGNGNNVLFLDNYCGTILHPKFTGIKIIETTPDSVYLKIGAGEIWDNVVKYAVQQNYHGIENLTSIPSSVGAAPIQNIGAYGVQFQDIFHSLTAYNIENHTFKEFQNQECQFGYRTSIFKIEKQWLITHVTLCLQKKPNYNLSYLGIKELLEQRNIQHPTTQDIIDAIRTIRNSKLPDPKLLGNAGSFFKNPNVSMNKYKELKEKFPDIVAYDNKDNTYRVAAGWLIEKCGWKGKQKGNVGVYHKQALILVNYGVQTGQEIWQFAQDIINTVQDTFQITLVPEVVII